MPRPTQPPFSWLEHPEGCPPDELLGVAAERGLTDAALAPLVEHLAGCDSCRAAFVELRRDEPARALPAVRPWVLAGLLGRLRVAVAARRPAAMTAAVLLVAGVAVAAPAVYLALNPPGPTTPREAPRGRSPASTGLVETPDSADRAEDHPQGPSQEGAVHHGEPPVGPSSIAAASAGLEPTTGESGPTEGPRRVARSPRGREPNAGRAPTDRPPRPAPRDERPRPERAPDRDWAEERFVEGVVHYQAKRYMEAVAVFDELLQRCPFEDISAMAARWRAKSVAEARGECQPGFVRRITVEPPRGGAGQGPVLHDDCVPAPRGWTEEP